MVFLSTCPVGFEDAVEIRPAKLPGFLELLFGGGRWRRMKWNEMSNSGSDKSWKKGRWTSDAVGSGDGEGLLKEVSSGLGVGGARPAGESEGADREEGMGHRGMCETPPWSLRDRWVSFLMQWEETRGLLSRAVMQRAGGVAGRRKYGFWVSRTRYSPGQCWGPFLLCLFCPRQYPGLGKLMMEMEVDWMLATPRDQVLIPWICKHHFVEKNGLCKHKEGFWDKVFTLNYWSGP